MNESGLEIFRKAAAGIVRRRFSLTKNFVFRQADPDKNAPLTGFFRPIFLFDNLYIYAQK